MAEVAVKSEPKCAPEGDDDAPPPWEDAYARHFTLVLSTILFERGDFRALLSAAELDVASRFLTELKPFEQQLYARLFQRQGPWYRTPSLFRYFLKAEDVKQEQEQQQQLPVNEQMQDVVHVMVEAGFLHPFPVSAAPKAAKTVATVADKQLSPGRKQQQELASLDAALDAIERCATAPELAALFKKMTGSRKHIAKADLMAAVKKVARTQRRIDGSRIPVAQLMQHIWLESYPLAGRKSSDVMALRMAPAARDLMLRMHRLFYFVSTPPFNATSLMPPQLESVGQLIALATHKLRQEPTQWPGLMVFFKKAAYPEYKQTTCSSGDETTTQRLNSHRVFPSAEAYVSFEVAYQLHRIMSVVEQCIEIVTPEKEYQEPDLELKWMLSDGPPVFLAFQRLLFILYEDEEATETEDECVVVVPPRKVEDKESANWQMRSWKQFYCEIERMQSLDDLVLASRVCLQAYLKWMMAAAYSTSGIPVYFAKCNAGYHLVRILHIAVTLYEKMRKYQIATLLLNELLAAPFLERKRGYWWDRLALNLEHLKCRDQARDACVNALQDPHVLAADRIALQRRLNRLDRQKDRDEKKRVESLSTDDLLLQSTGTSLITPSMDVNEDNADEGKTGPAAALPTYEYRQNHVVGRPLNRQTGEKSRFVGYDDEPCTVEQLVLQYYRDHHPVDEASEDTTKIGGWYGVHSEGMVFGNLFGILMWDILYASIPNVFQTPFQSAPLDFGYADVFYEGRRDLIERRIAQVADEWTMEELLASFMTRWSSEFGKVTRFVHWPSDDVASLHFHLLTIAAIGRTELAKLLRYMATSKEFHQAQNGLPDLLLLRLESPRPEDDRVPPSSQWTTDSHGCLNIHAFCGMDEELNMNEKTNSNTVSVEEEDLKEVTSEDKLDEQPLQHVLDLLKDGSYVTHLKLVEVKGPRDRLSDKQLLWLQVLNEEIGLDASVMHVEEPEKHAKRKKKESATTAKSAPKKRQYKRRK
ncbi:Fanconi-associated nuclease 1 [Phytophthora pseudosyringae]|uniref:Fanconi-associated nuclease n=1 Tax=Phytophthora pseudosyringae TaxID=221518 RepID=A0A8T1WHL7_9STRA|nr:Fanconi-associated nuclease 1 [Phytophthora pseudosyringae]